MNMNEFFIRHFICILFFESTVSTMPQPNPSQCVTFENRALPCSVRVGILNLKFHSL